MTVFGLLGATALWLTFAWLLSAIGMLIWLAWPARGGSDWKVRGPIPRKRKSAAEG